jgi:stage II sporulation protein E
VKTKAATVRTKTGLNTRLQAGISERLENLNERARMIIGYLLRFAAGWLLSQTSLFGTYPLVLGFTGACGGGLGGLASVIGTVICVVSKGGFNRAVKYSAISLLIYSAAFIFKDTGLFKKKWFMPSAVGLMTALTGFVYARHNGWGLETTVLYIAEVILAIGSCMLYTAALSGAKDEKGYIGKAAFGMSLSLALVRLTFFGSISVGRITAALAVMAASCVGGGGAGSIAGLALGMALDAALGSHGSFVLSYGFAGMFSGFYMKKGRLAVAVCYVLANAVGAFWGVEEYLRTTFLIEVFIASVILMLLPNEWLMKLKAEKTVVLYKGGIREMEYQLSKARLASSAFDEIYGILKRTTEAGRNDNDISSVFDVAAEEVCRRCERRGECWGSRYESTKNVINDVTLRMGARGYISAEDFPQHFRDLCLNIQAFTGSVNNELKALYRRRQFLNRLKENRELLYKQYEDMSKLLKGIGVRGSVSDTAAVSGTESRIDAYLRASGIAAESYVFRDANGRLHIDIEGGGLFGLLRTKGWLDMLSSAAEMRLCCLNSNIKDTDNVLHLLEAEPLAANVGIASLCKEGQAQSGDMATYFKTPEGMLYLIISDGMGSGREAAADSGDAVKITEKLLRAGLNPDLAMSILDSAMLLRSDKNMGCASIDLMGINLFNGETVMYKYGAAPSYVRKGDRVFEVNGESLAAGLGGGAPDLTRLRLTEGSAAVIVSDGATGCTEEILEKLYDINAENVKKLACSILESVARIGKTRDDMTVLTLSVEARK